MEVGRALQLPSALVGRAVVLLSEVPLCRYRRPLHMLCDTPHYGIMVQVWGSFNVREVGISYDVGMSPI